MCVLAFFFLYFCHFHFLYMRKKYQAHLFIQFLCVYPSPRCATISRKIKRQTDKLLFIRTCYAQSIFDLSDLYRCAISRKTTFNYVYTIHLKQISILKACILLLSFPDESIATTKEARQDWTFIQQETQFQDQNPTQNNDDPEKHIPYPPAYGNCTASSHCLGHNVECNLRLSRCVSITTDKSIITNQKKNKPEISMQTKITFVHLYVILQVCRRNYADNGTGICNECPFEGDPCTSCCSESGVACINGICRRCFTDDGRSLCKWVTICQFIAKWWSLNLVYVLFISATMPF